MVRQLARVEPTPEEQLAAQLDSWEAHVSAWIDCREEVTKRQFVLGLIASSVEMKYGEKSLAKFAQDVKENIETVHVYRNVYRKCNEYWMRFQNLSWSHFATVAKTELDTAERQLLLEQAADGDWTTRQLKRAVGAHAIKKEMASSLPQIDPQMASAISHWRELRPSIVRFAEANPQFWAYTDDYVEDVDEAIKQPWNSAREYLERLIFAGYREVEFLAQKARWTKETIERLCGELVEAGSHEWRDKGGKTDDARGARPRLIVPVEEPSGDAYESYHGPRMSLLPDDEE